MLKTKVKAKINKYLIKYKIATVAELVTPFELDGYKFTSYNKDWWQGDAWVVSKVISAGHAGIARYEFMKNLIPIVEKCSVVSECAFRFEANSYIIYKQTNNPEKIIFIYFVRNDGHTGLMFQEEQVNQLEKLALVPNQHAFMYITEVANANTFYSRLGMLISAVEALAGEEVTGEYTHTNKDELKKILGGELTEKLYKYGKGLRHKLLHGNKLEHPLFDGLTENIYHKILDYLRTTYDIQIERGVVNPQRNFYDNFSSTSMFMSFVDKEVLDLKEVEEIIDDRIKSRVKENEIFSYVGNQDKY